MYSQSSRIEGFGIDLGPATISDFVSAKVFRFFLNTQDIKLKRKVCFIVPPESEGVYYYVCMSHKPLPFPFIVGGHPLFQQH
jgi:hypothetical protein